MAKIQVNLSGGYWSLMEPSRVIIIGAGFAGLQAARSLRGLPYVSITVIDRLNHHLFQPLLYQVASAALSPSDIAVPVRKILKKQDNVHFLMATVVSIDKDAQQVLLADGSSLEYDWLVVSPGAKHSYFGKDSWARYAPGLKTIRDALEIREKILVSFELADQESDSAKIAELLTFVIIGGGPTGVELAGSIAEIAVKTIACSYKRINTKNSKIVLIEGAKNILPAYPESLSKKAEKELQSLGVEVLTSTKVTDVTDEGVCTDTKGHIASRCVIWAAGNQASELIATLGCEMDRQGRAIVEPDFTLPGYPNLFVVGDAAHCRDMKGAPLPGLAPVAKQGGGYVANIIRNQGSPSSRRPFVYSDKGSMATIGRGRAVALMGKVQLSGVIAWSSWIFIHIWYLIGFTNKLYVFLRWIFLYFSSKRSALLITRPIDKKREK